MLVAMGGVYSRHPWRIVKKYRHPGGVQQCGIGEKSHCVAPLRGAFFLRTVPWVARIRATAVRRRTHGYKYHTTPW
jgi:hypothetical protein